MENNQFVRTRKWSVAAWARLITLSLALIVTVPAVLVTTLQIETPPHSTVSDRVFDVCMLAALPTLWVGRLFGNPEYPNAWAFGLVETTLNAVLALIMGTVIGALINRLKRQ
jgi:hypothetical protein